MPRRPSSKVENASIPAAPTSIGKTVASMSSEEAQELTAAVDALAKLLYEEKLSAAVESLTREIRQLGMILDEIRSEMVYAVRNPRPGDVSFWRPALSPATEAEEEHEGDDAMPVPPPPVRPTAPATDSHPAVHRPEEPALARKDQRKLFG